MTEEPDIGSQNLCFLPPRPQKECPEPRLLMDRKGRGREEGGSIGDRQFLLEPCYENLEKAVSV